MKKFSGWMIFWSIVIILNIYLFIDGFIKLNKFNTDFPFASDQEQMKDYNALCSIPILQTQYNMNLAYNFGTLILTGIILFILYKKA